MGKRGPKPKPWNCPDCSRLFVAGERPRDDSGRLRASCGCRTNREWTCPSCGGMVPHAERHRDKTGHLSKHCGCRAGKCGKQKTGLYKWGFDLNTAEGGRLARLCAIPGYKATKQDEQVKLYKAQPKPKPQVFDAHVRQWKSDAARMMRWRTRYVDAFRLNQRMRVQIRKALKGNKAGRRWEHLVGYSLDELAACLRKQLPKGVTLSDALEHGWHIDHIVPKSLYDVTKEEELRAAWCMSNLRLVPATVNLSKRDTRVYLL